MQPKAPRQGVAGFLEGSSWGLHGSQAARPISRSYPSAAAVNAKSRVGAHPEARSCT